MSGQETNSGTNSNVYFSSRSASAFFLKEKSLGEYKKNEDSNSLYWVFSRMWRSFRLRKSGRRGKYRDDTERFLKRMGRRIQHGLPVRRRRCPWFVRNRLGQLRARYRCVRIPPGFDHVSRRLEVNSPQGSVVGTP